MSIQAIHHYHNQVHKIYQYSGQNHEQTIKDEFKRLLNHYCEKRDLWTVSEQSIATPRGKTIRPDGIVKNILSLNHGYWESKANVDLEKEIEAKIRAGYPLTNTVFQDNKAAILYQNNERVFNTALDNERELDKLLTQFVNYENQEIKEFNTALEQFKQDLPHILNALRDMINKQELTNTAFIDARSDFLGICQHSIKPDVTLADVNEMLLQHILTKDIFISIFNNAQFHDENNIAKELNKVEQTFFSGKTRYDTLAAIQYYYRTIKTKVAEIPHYHDKQRFLKIVYETFYKAYNPKAADKMGIVYTPHEIVKFQIESVDYLLEKHFKKSLADNGIKILDPCTGTGTYICDLIEYLPPVPFQVSRKDSFKQFEIGTSFLMFNQFNTSYFLKYKITNVLQKTGSVKKIIAHKKILRSIFNFDVVKYKFT